MLTGGDDAAPKKEAAAEVKPIQNETDKTTDDTKEVANNLNANE